MRFNQASIFTPKPCFCRNFWWALELTFTNITDARLHDSTMKWLEAEFCASWCQGLNDAWDIVATENETCHFAMSLHCPPQSILRILQARIMTTLTNIEIQNLLLYLAWALLVWCTTIMRRQVRSDTQRMVKWLQYHVTFAWSPLMMSEVGLQDSLRDQHTSSPVSWSQPRLGWGACREGMGSHL